MFRPPGFESPKRPAERADWPPSPIWTGQYPIIGSWLEDYEKIRKIGVLRSDFPDTVRSVTAFQKIKVDRKAAEELYREEIDRIYRES